MLGPVFATVFSFLSCTGAIAQSNHGLPLKNRLNEVVRAYADTDAFMGSVLVIQEETVLLDQGYGSANLEWDIPNDPHVKFRIGSLTKQFTAALVLQLQEKKQLKIDDPLSKYLSSAPQAWSKITIAELLGHTSGIPNFITDSSYRTWSMSPHSVAEELAFFRNKPLNFEPGTKFEYSNSNYIVLGAIIEKVAGQSIAAFYKRKF